MRSSKEGNRLIILGGVGEKNFGNRYRPGNTIHDSNGVAATITASPVGNMGGGNSAISCKDQIR